MPFTQKQLGLINVQLIKRFDQIIYLLNLIKERFQLIQRQRTRTIALSLVRIRMSFQKQPGKPHGHARSRKFGFLLPSASRGRSARIPALQ